MVGGKAQAGGGWSFFIPTQTLQMQGTVNGMLPIMAAIVVQGQQGNAFIGFDNDGKTYAFIRMQGHDPPARRRTMRKIAIALTKGGVGKTTTAVNLAAGLALAGQRVLLVDVDTQGQSARSLGLQPAAGLAELAAGEATPEQAITLPARTCGCWAEVGRWPTSSG